MKDENTLNLMSIAKFRKTQAPENSVAEPLPLLTSILIQLGKALGVREKGLSEAGFKDQQLEQFARLFVLLSFGLVNPTLTDGLIQEADGRYQAAWNTFSLVGKDFGYLFGFIQSLQPSTIPFAMAQLAMICAQRGIKRAAFEERVQMIEFCDAGSGDGLDE